MNKYFYNIDNNSQSDSSGAFILQRKIIALAFLFIVVCIIGGIFGYNSYLNHKFDESFKKQYYFSTLGRNESPIEVNLDYINMSIPYAEDMVKYAPSEIYRNYSETLLELKKEYIKLMLLEKQLTDNNTNPNNKNELNNQINQERNSYMELIKKKDQIKLENPELQKRIDKLVGEVKGLERNETDF